jgi:site-specific DNA recombinase
MAKKIISIPATRNRFTEQPLARPSKRKVCGYARVSTDHEEQQSSYEAQMSYYSNYIRSRPDWEFVGMYSDEGISGTSTTHRAGFQKMIADALAGKINLIITKSVSRFARNTVDSLTTVRKLKEHGIEVYFEKENIWTLDSKGELLITIMSSLAQEESRSISENTTWGRRKQFQDGKVSMNYHLFLGYDEGFVINPEQAKVVRLIYKLFLNGYSYDAVAIKLTEMGVPTASGKGKRWNKAVVKSILTNEKYKGDALLQKYYTADFLTKKQVLNEGEIPQYYVKHHHEPIIDPDLFDLVQIEVRRRADLPGRYSAVSIFSGRIFCGLCGNVYGRKIWHSGTKYASNHWRCNHMYNTRGKKCKTPVLSEEEIKALFLKAFNKVFTEKEEVIQNLTLLEKMMDESKYEQQAETLRKELEHYANHASSNITNNELLEAYQKKNDEYEKLMKDIEHARDKRIEIRIFIRELQKMTGILKEFSEELWGSTVNKVTMQVNGDAVFEFRGGMEVTVR